MVEILFLRSHRIQLVLITSLFPSRDFLVSATSYSPNGHSESYHVLIFALEEAVSRTNDLDQVFTILIDCKIKVILVFTGKNSDEVKKRCRAVAAILTTSCVGAGVDFSMTEEDLEAGMTHVRYVVGIVAPC